VQIYNLIHYLQLAYFKEQWIHIDINNCSQIDKYFISKVLALVAGEQDLYLLTTMISFISIEALKIVSLK